VRHRPGLVARQSIMNVREVGTHFARDAVGEGVLRCRRHERRAVAAYLRDPSPPVGAGHRARDSCPMAGALSFSHGTRTPAFATCCVAIGAKAKNVPESAPGAVYEIRGSAGIHRFGREHRARALAARSALRRA